MSNSENASKRNWGKLLLEICFLLVLALYPMRHLDMGGDLWDIGYNYGNYKYHQLGRIGEMWYFSTYLAGVVGHFLTQLPFGDVYIGLNLYTGVFVSLLAIIGYLFFTRTLKVSPILAFAGEMAAISMCWCPTALLYNYLTYLLFTGCVIFLYHGLTKKKKVFLFLAGACLGTNVFVRFSNLPEMGMILAVWCHSIWNGKEEAKEEGSKEAKAGWFGKAMGDLAGKTVWCLIGYLVAFLLIFGWISFLYGAKKYVNGISQLFAMTEVATDYKPTSMIAGLIWPYKEGLFWVIRLAFFAFAASLIRVAAGFLPRVLKEESREKGRKIFDFIGQTGVIVVILLMFAWMFWQREEQPNFTSFFYTSYDPIYWPGTLFLMLAMGIGLIETFRPGNGKENRFLGLATFLLVLITSIGSNNGIYPSMNHLFLPAPYVLWKLGEFTMWSLKKAINRSKEKSELCLSLVPACAAVWAFVFACGMQFFMFGRYFVFCEGTGMQQKAYEVLGNRVLEGVQMGEERAAYIGNLVDYVNGHNLAGQEVILHGNVPALAFYLEMPPAFHSWNDLDSFSLDVMKQTVEQLEIAIDGKRRGKPVVIAATAYAEYGPIAPGDEETPVALEDPKWQLIQEFMGKYGYERKFMNAYFTVWEATK